jgi:hypothetical protein
MMIQMYLGELHLRKCRGSNLMRAARSCHFRIYEAGLPALIKEEAAVEYRNDSTMRNLGARLSGRTNNLDEQATALEKPAKFAFFLQVADTMSIQWHRQADGRLVMHSFGFELFQLMRRTNLLYLSSETAFAAYMKHSSALRISPAWTKRSGKKEEIS